MMPETNSIRCGTSKIMSLAVPDCLTWPLMLNERPTCAMSWILDLGMNLLSYGQPRSSAEHRQELVKTDPTGQKVSKPLATDQGSPFFFAASWTLRAVMSIASAAVCLSFTTSVPSVRCRTHCIPQCTTQRRLWECLARSCRSRRRAQLPRVRSPIADRGVTHPRGG